MDKKTVYLLISAGGLIGSYLPVLLFKANGFGLASILGGIIGSIIGVFVAYKMS